MEITNRKHKTFEVEQDWIDYVNTHMKDAVRTEGMAQVIIQTEEGETIAVWQNFGLGHIMEARSPERLKFDVY